METVEISIQHPAGLHARPASKFVRMAASFPCEIRVVDLTKGSEAVNAKSILGVLSLGADQGHQIRIETEGEREAEAAEALRLLIENNFGEGAPS
jgi:phosphotransferase system HPr (HPr) family protein